MRELLQTRHWSPTSDESFEILKAAFASRIPDDALKALQANAFRSDIEDAIVKALDGSMRGLVVGNRALEIVDIAIVRLESVLASEGLASKDGRKKKRTGMDIMFKEAQIQPES